MIPGADVSVAESAFGNRMLQDIVGNMRAFGSFNVATYLSKLHVMSAMEVVLEIMGDPLCPASTRLMAAKEILNRGYGVPALAIPPGEEGLSPEMVADQISDHIQLLVESQKYVGVVDPEQWPDHIRRFLKVVPAEAIDVEVISKETTPTSPLASK